MVKSYFDCRHYQIQHLIELIEFVKSSEYSPRTMAKLKDTVYQLKKAIIMTSHVDWLLSGAIGEEDFIDHLDNELLQLALEKEDYYD